VVAAEPELGYILKSLVLPDFLGIYVAVVVYYRVILCVFVIQKLGGIRRKQKIIV
jgi:hypothetical protein